MSQTRWTLLALLALVFSVQGAGLKPLSEMTTADEESWNRIKEARLSPEGHWFAYLLVRNNAAADAVAVLRATRGNQQRRYPLGSMRQGAGALAMSNSGRWIAFKKISASGSGVPSATGAPSVSTTVTAIEVSSGRKLEFPKTRRFAFIGEASESIVLESYPGAESSPLVDVTVVKLATGKSTTLNQVAEYACDASGQRLAWTGPQGVQIRELDSGRTQILDNATGSRYVSPTWSKRGRALAVLRLGGDAEALLTFTRIDTGQPQRQEFVTAQWPGYPKGYELNAEVFASFDLTLKPLTWRDDEAGVFFGIRPENRPQPPTGAKVTNLVLWHWQDQQLPQAKKMADGLRRSDLCFVSLSQGRFVRLMDRQISHVDMHPIAPYVLGFDINPYGWMNPPAGMKKSQRRDYYLIDLTDGSRHPVVKNLPTVTWPRLSVPPQLSPDGSKVLYQDENGDYIAYEVATKTRRNLTATLPTRFYYDENRPEKQRQPRPRDGDPIPVLQGWALDEQTALISDYYDIWALPLDGSKAVNLTGNGRRDGIVYNRADILADPQQQTVPIDLKAPIHFYALDLKTGDEGIARYRQGQGLRILFWRPAGILNYRSARLADAHIYTMQSTRQYPDYYFVERDWKSPKQLTEANPQQKQWQWVPDAKYLTYKTSHGDVLNAVLWPPAGYVSGRSYPTFVSIYEEWPGSLHMYQDPTALRWQREGYAVLQPNIRPRFNEAGRAALESVTAAVDAAVASGIVDRERMGLTGPSHGAYETYYIISKTHLFKAAVAESGIVDLLSHSGEVAGGRPMSIAMETYQPYMSGPWWEQWDAYIEGSALFSAQNIATPLLMIHGDEDPAISCQQAISMFNTLRRMGKPAVLLEYQGESHVFTKAAKADFMRRTHQFFDYYLKGASAPDWWSDGLSYYEGQAPSSLQPNVEK